MKKARRSAGFTLLELIVAVTIVSVVAGVTIWGFTRSKRGRVLVDSSRRIMSAVQQARTVGGTGREVDTLTRSAGNTLTLRVGGLRIVDNTTIEIFGDTDRLEGGERVLEVVDLSANIGGLPIYISSPAVGGEIRFNRNSTRELSSPDYIELTDRESGATRRITIAAAGLPRME